VKTSEGIRVSLRQHSLGGYSLLAYVISWFIWAPLVASAQGWYEGPVSPYLYALGFMGPAVAAVLVVGITEGSAGIRRLMSQVLRHRVGVRWYLFVLLVPPLLFGLSAAVARLFGAPWPEWRLYGRMDDLLPGFGLCASWLSHLLIVGMGEEVGWRGYALPQLQAGRSALKATALLSVVWGLWHVPTFLFDQELAPGLGMAVGFLFTTFPVAVLYTWLYNSTGGSVLLVSLWSTGTTLAIGSPAAVGSIPMIMVALMTILAMIATNVAGAENLSRTGKRIILHQGSNRLETGGE